VCHHSSRHYKLEKWANGNLIKFEKGKFKVLPLSKNDRHQHTLGAGQLESSPEEKDLGYLVSKLNMSQECTLMAEQSSSFLGCTRKSFATRSSK